MTQAIRGLGGIGKTQLAVEYAYRYQKEYEHVFWVQLTDDDQEAEELKEKISSDPSLQILGSYVDYCKKLQIPFDETKAETVKQALKRWMEQHPNWLMIYDNADQPDCLESFLPLQSQGHILLTSRANIFARLGILEPIDVQKLPLDQATEFLIKRVSKRLDDSEQNLARKLATELDGLPLALEQAGAYIQETAITFKRYLENYRRLKLDLLEKQKPVMGDYPESVQTTWSMNFEEIKQQAETTADLLRFCAFLAPDAIPYDLIAEGAGFLGEAIEEVISQSDDPMLAVNDVLQPLLKYSLISIVPGKEEFSIHRLVQEVMKAEVQSRDEEPIWEERVVNTVNQIYPWPEPNNWKTCRRLLPQSKTAIEYIKHSKIKTENSGDLLIKQGRFFFDAGEYAEAEPLYLQAIEIRRAVLGETHPDFATTLNNLAGLYKSQGRYEDAEPLFLQAIEIRCAVQGETHPDFATSLNNLAGLYKSQGRYEDAEPLYLQAMEIRRAVLGEDHPSFAISLSNLALLYINQGRYADAEPLYLDAIEICRAVLGETHPDFAGSLNQLASLYRIQGRYAEAEPLFLQAMEIRRAVLGEDHPSFAISLNNLALLYLKQRRYVEVEPYYLQAMKICRAVLGENHPNFATSLDNLASLYRTQGRYAEAEPLFLQAMEIRRAVLGEDHPSFATSLNNLASFYRIQGRYAEVGALYLQSIEILLSTFGSDHPNSKIVMSNYQRFKEMRTEDKEDEKEKDA
ncbi:photosystem I assembly protein Ycf3 [Gimesia alba]|uniref:Photosystem I assembly protein Ycf3 n=1 Tax=Gimesia alba TaxID=2527973 RepID=A0A517RFK6_9PLAN|nr:photosystem I assembly protein Ycf3 [Gimesia alba]